MSDIFNLVGNSSKHWFDPLGLDRFQVGLQQYKENTPYSYAPLFLEIHRKGNEKEGWEKTVLSKKGLKTKISVLQSTSFCSISLI